MRIGTWNLAGRWSSGHLELLRRARCEVWLLTEVSEDTALPGYAVHGTSARMASRRRWAAVASRLPAASLPDPHPASAAAQVGGLTFVSSILPWKGASSRSPWVGARHADKTVAAVDDLVLRLRTYPRLVWGGDWNHALVGREYAGSMAGRASVTAALAELGLTAATTDLPHRIDGLLTIDHVAVPASAPTPAVASRVPAQVGGKRLSDHDAYVVEVDL